MIKYVKPLFIFPRVGYLDHRVLIFKIVKPDLDIADTGLAEIEVRSIGDVGNGSLGYVSGVDGYYGGQRGKG